MPEFVEQVAADLVLPALAAVQGQLQGGDAVPARFQRQHAAVFVVGMRGGVHQAGRGVQAAQGQLQAGDAGVHGQRLGVDPRGRDLRAGAAASASNTNVSRLRRQAPDLRICRNRIRRRDSLQGDRILPSQTTQTAPSAREAGQIAMRCSGRYKSAGTVGPWLSRISSDLRRAGDGLDNAHSLNQLHEIVGRACSLRRTC